MMFSPGVGWVGGGWERAENKDWLEPINIVLYHVLAKVEEKLFFANAEKPNFGTWQCYSPDTISK